MNDELTQDECYAVAELINVNLFDIIRNDTDIDSMRWLRNVVRAYEKLCRRSGYRGATEPIAEAYNRDPFDVQTPERNEDES